jgi:hypothetical protein
MRIVDHVISIAGPGSKHMDRRLHSLLWKAALQEFLRRGDAVDTHLARHGILERLVILMRRKRWIFAERCKDISH